jgi:hypothetical protein
MKKFRKREDAQCIADKNKSFDEDGWTYTVIEVIPERFVVEVYDEDGELVGTL